MKATFGLCVKIWTFIYLMQIVSSQNITIISTKLGMLQGVSRTFYEKNTKVNEFLKIPYAKPPLTSLRFEKPQPFGTWNGILDATKYGPSCFQVLKTLKDILPNKNISEDCLHLNIYVPGDISTNTNKSVMVWIHGGAYLAGQASLYKGAYLAATGDVIVVTIQYRLGVFGFFSNTVLKGNYGLWDQIMAIQWVKDNIESFGGNSESITIFGESAGGFSVGLLSIIPRNRGLFQRAILESGTVISTYTITNDRSSSEAVSKYLNCMDSNTLLVVKCLKNKTTEELFAASSKSIYFSSFFKSPFAPVVDGELLTETPNDVLKNKESEGYKFYRSLDIVVGTVTGESSLLFNVLSTDVQSFLNFNLSDGIPKRILCDVIALDIATVTYMKDNRISKAICEYYGSENTSIDISQNILNTFSDFVFFIPTIQSLNIHSQNDNKNSNRYQYIFSRPSPIPIGRQPPAWFDGAEHGSEVVFLFSNNSRDRNDTYLAHSLMTYWAHFAKTGDMNVTGLPEWKQYDEKDGHYLNFDVPITTGQHLYKDRVKFWLTDIPLILHNQVLSGCDRIHECQRHVVLLCLAVLLFFMSFSYHGLP